MEVSYMIEGSNRNFLFSLHLVHLKEVAAVCLVPTRCSMMRVAEKSTALGKIHFEIDQARYYSVHVVFKDCCILIEHCWMVELIFLSENSP